ncbi:MAG TPA: hypothetical protein VJN93_02500 [Candidatus Acidoferrum sp.]|nr:hypothetical protein [Candidatus Acidoferrum sp.]
MRISGAPPYRQLRRGQSALLLVLLIGAAAAYEFAKFILNGDLTALAFTALGAAGAAGVLAISKNWRNGLYCFLTWLLFEDFVRKFQNNDIAIFFVKDLLLLVILISFLGAVRRKEVKIFRPPFMLPLVIFMWFAAMQIFNPGSPSIWYGLMGFKMFFYYVPLFFIGYSFLNSETELRRFFTVNLLLVLVVISLGIAQSIIGPRFLNPAMQAKDLQELSGLYRVAPTTGEVAYRPTSVFVSAGRYSNFIMVAWIVVLGFSGYLLLRHKRGRILAFIALPVTAAGAFLTASRGSFMWGMINAVATSVAFIWGAPWRQGKARSAFRVILRAGFGIGLGILLLFYFYPHALQSRLAIYEETLMPNSATSELQNRGWTYPVDNFLGAFNSDRWPYGYGIGTASNGTQYVSRIFHVKPLGYEVESGFGTLVLEMGIGGLILWFVTGGTILFTSWQVVRKLKGSPWFPIAFVIFWYAFFLLGPATFGGMASYEDYLMNAYFWLLLGLLFRLPTLPLSAQFAATTSAASLPSNGVA